MKTFIQNHLPLSYQMHFWKGAYLNEAFVEQVYHWLAMKFRSNTTVIDIDAAIGETAIYFAQFKEVDKVIAFEPSLKLYQCGKQMLEKCPLRDKIDYRYGAVSEKAGMTKVSDKILGNKQFSSIGNQQTGREVKVYSLDEVLKQIDTPIAIKSDCEGDEKLIFPNSDLSKVYAIELEDHFNLRDHMKQVFEYKGFKTIELSGLNEMGCGLMGAWR